MSEWVKEHVVMSICMHRKAAVTSGMLQVHLRHDLCNTIFKGKGKGRPRIGHEGPKGQYRYSSNLS